MATNEKLKAGWRSKIHEVIFEADTKAGRRFDILLIISILFSVLAVMLESIPSIGDIYGHELYLTEWLFTILFTIEYILRLISIGRPLKYALSFFGVVDLLAIVPTYFSILFPGTHTLAVIRILRVLRVFRVLKLAKYLKEAQVLVKALKASRRKIIVFLITVLALVIIFGSIMYLIEGDENGFISIPRSIYWAIVTLTTVGYGDITPHTDLGRMVSALVMIMGYSIIAVPTGIITAEITRSIKKEVSTQSCPQCSLEGHDKDAKFCKFCGAIL